VYGIDIAHGDPYLSSTRVLTGYGLREVEQHVIPRGEVPPSHVVVRCVVASVLMRLVIEFEPEELPVELR
jgi:hypothetical protein